MILERPINIYDDRELAEDVPLQAIKDKGKAFAYKFNDVRTLFRGIVASGPQYVTDREIFNIVDNCYRSEPVIEMAERLTRIHNHRMQERN